MPHRITHMLFSVLVLALGAWAQNSPHEHPPADMIDGAVHPELVPDSTAYRLWLLTVSEMPNTTLERKVRQRAFLSKVRLSGADYATLVTILEQFKEGHTNLVNQYNDEAKLAEESGRAADIQSFLQQRNKLVQATRDAIKALLSPQGSARLEEKVQKEKTKMKVDATEAQQ